jgi:ferredoxin-NADP reductase
MRSATAATSGRRILDWQLATIAAIREETPRVRSYTLRLPNWTPHRPGQHYDLRLTAADGYSAQRSYSIASGPEREGEIEVTVERVADGEVSPFLHDVAVIGDQIEVRGPIGGYFVWHAGLGGPLLLIAGGSGIVPLMAMLRHRAAATPRPATRLLYSSRTPEDIIYAGELRDMAARGDGLEVIHTLTRSQPAGWTGYARRIDDQMLTEVRRPLDSAPLVFICGPTPLVEGAASGLVRIGVPAQRIRTERFGPSGK